MRMPRTSPVHRVAVSVLAAAGDWDLADQLQAVRDVVASSTTYLIGSGDMGSLEAEVGALAARLVDLGPAVVSVLAGATVGARRAAAQLTSLVRAALPDVETFVLVGGQPEPALIISAQ